MQKKVKKLSKVLKDIDYSAILEELYKEQEEYVEKHGYPNFVIMQDIQVFKGQL